MTDQQHVLEVFDFGYCLSIHSAPDLVDCQS